MNSTKPEDKPSPFSPIAGASDDAFSALNFTVPILVLDAGATQVKRQKERSKQDELWQGDGFNPLEPNEPGTPLFFRLAEGNVLVAELICACLARALQLPVPEIFLVTIPPGHLPKSKLVNRNSPTMCVGTRDIGGKNFAQLLSDDVEAALPLLREWPELGKVAAFDEWLANPDRNLGNLVYAMQTLHIIDHAEAFGGSSKALFPLVELTEMQFKNILMDLIQNCFKPNRVHLLLAQVQEWLTNTAGNIDLEAVVQTSRTDHWTDKVQQTELIKFMAERLTLTYALLCQRMGQPQLKLQAPT